MIKICISVTSHALGPTSPLSQTVTRSGTPSPLERDVLYGRPLDSGVNRATGLRKLISASVLGGFQGPGEITGRRSPGGDLRRGRSPGISPGDHRGESPRPIP